MSKAIEGGLIVLGAVALIPAIIVALLLLAMWKAWWLHPLWTLVIVPLGLPQIGYWHLVALSSFMTALSGQALHGYDHAKEQDDTRKRANLIGVMLAALVGPPLVYYYIGWLL